MQMISKNTLSQIFKEHNIEVDRISKIRTLQTLLNDTTLDIPLMRREVNQINMRWILRNVLVNNCLLYTSPSPRDLSTSRMPSSA